MGAETSGMATFPQPDRGRPLLIASTLLPEALAYASHQLVPHLAIIIEPLLPAAFARGWIHRRPIFDIGCDLVGQLQSLVMCRRRKRHNKIEIESFEILKFLKRDRLVARDIDADFLHDGNCEGIEFALLHASGADIDRRSQHLPEQPGSYRRTHRVHAACE